MLVNAFNDVNNKTLLVIILSHSVPFKGKSFVCITLSKYIYAYGLYKIKESFLQFFRPLLLNLKLG